MEKHRLTNVFENVSTYVEETMIGYNFSWNVSLVVNYCLFSCNVHTFSMHLQVPPGNMCKLKISIRKSQERRIYKLHIADKSIPEGKQPHQWIWAETHSRVEPHEADSIKRTCKRLSNGLRAWFGSWVWGSPQPTCCIGPWWCMNLMGCHQVSETWSKQLACSEHQPPPAFLI